MPRRVEPVDSAPVSEIVSPVPNLPAIREEPTASLSAYFWGLALTLLAVVVVGGYFGRAQIVESWPAAARFYQAVSDVTGLALLPPAEPLTIRDVNTRRTVREGRPVLVIAGTIENPSASVHDVPGLSVMLLDAAGGVVLESSFTPRATRLRPGESVTFRTQIVDPPADAVDLTLELHFVR